MKDGQQDSLTTREREIQVQTQMDIISGYYRKVGLTPEITIEDILQILEADLQYIRESNAVISVEKIINSTSLPSSSVTGEKTGKTKEQCLKDRDVSIDRWPDTRDLIYLAMDDYSKQFRVTGESEAIGERKFTLKEALDIWDAAINHHVSVSDFDCESLPDKEVYFLKKFNIELK